MGLILIVTLLYIIYTIYSVKYKLFMCKRALNKRTNLGRIYLENIYIITVNNKKLNKREARVAKT